MGEFFRNVWLQMVADPGIRVTVMTGVAGLLVATIAGAISIWNSWSALNQTRALTERQNDLNLLDRFGRFTLAVKAGSAFLFMSSR